MERQDINNEALEVIKKAGYEILSETHIGWDRRGFTPDSVKFQIKKGEEFIAGVEHVSDFNQCKFDEYGDEIIDFIMKYRQDKEYQTHAKNFESKANELEELRQTHKFGKFAEKKALKKEVEELKFFNKVRGQYDYLSCKINIPMLEENKNELLELRNELKTLRESTSQR